MLEIINKIIKKNLNGYLNHKDYIKKLEREATYKDNMVFNLTDLIKEYVNKRDNLINNYQYTKYTKKQHYQLVKEQDELFLSFIREMTEDCQAVNNLLEDYYKQKINKGDFENGIQ